MSLDGRTRRKPGPPIVRSRHRISVRLSPLALAILPGYCRLHRLNVSDAVNQMIEQAGRPRPVASSRRW